MNDMYVSRGTRLAAREVAGEMVILSADDSSLYVLNEVATTVWRHADGCTPLRSVATTIAGEFEVEVDEALADIRILVEQLAAAGILTTSPEPLSNGID